MNTHLKALSIFGLGLSIVSARSANFNWGSSAYTWKGNFGGDTRTDIASANGGNVYVNLSDGTGFISLTWTVPNMWGSGAYTWVGDFNGDMKTDIASANGGNVYMNLSTGASFARSTWTVPNSWGNPEYTWVADFDGDGKSDIASANAGSVYMHLSTGTGFSNTTWTVPNAWGSAAYTWIGDFNGDGKADIASANGGNVYVHLSTGSGFTNQTWNVPNTWGGPGYTWVGDFNGDGKTDIASANGGNIYVHLSTGSGFNNYTWMVTNAWGNPEYTWVGDFNGDGKTDIASANAGNVYMYLSTGSGFSSGTWVVPNTWGASGYTWIGDFNGDGKADIASANGNAIYMNLSTGTSFTSSTWRSQSTADSSFTMVFMSDPQFAWSCSSEKNTTNDYCRVAANRDKSLEAQAQETNSLHISTIKAIKNGVTNFAGVVINGDLTDFGSQDEHLGSFTSNYLNMGVTVWPGLGNHDYQNNVNDCGAKGWANWNYCGADMAQFLAGYALSSGSISNNDVTKYDKNFAQAQDQRNVSGSLAYSWDLGKFHFVELNNYPTYTVSFTRGYVSGISSWDINITSPAGWLAADLGAVAPGRSIILNWHKYGDIYSDSAQKAALIAMLSPYAASIKAIFVGHFHWMFGQNDFLTFPATATRSQINVPVIYSGSAIYSRFIRADFDTRTGCAITTNVINTVSGSPVNANNSNGGTGTYAINCQ